MARLWSSGFELNSTTEDVEASSFSGSIESSPVRSGTYSLGKNVGNSNGDFLYPFAF